MKRRKLLCLVGSLVVIALGATITGCTTSSEKQQQYKSEGLEALNKGQYAEELKKTPEGTEVFKTAGNLLIKVERNSTLEELEDKLETLKLRQQTMTRQEERVMKKLEEMQATIQRAMGGLQGQ